MHAGGDEEHRAAACTPRRRRLRTRSPSAERASSAPPARATSPFMGARPCSDTARAGRHTRPVAARPCRIRACPCGPAAPPSASPSWSRPPDSAWRVPLLTEPVDPHRWPQRHACTRAAPGRPARQCGRGGALRHHHPVAVAPAASCQPAWADGRPSPQCDVRARQRHGLAPLLPADGTDLGSLKPQPAAVRRLRRGPRPMGTRVAAPCG